MTALLRAAALAALVATGVPVAAHHINDDQLVLARSFVAEAGFRAPQDWAAMAWIHKRHADRRGVSLAVQVRDYCAIWKRTPEGRGWVLQLHPSMREPIDWPVEHVRWSQHVRLWRNALLRAGQFVRAPETVKDPCQAQAQHFGGSMDAPRPGWRAVNCGPMRQRYWRVR